MALDEVERQHIKAVLKRTGFHKSRTAEILGISRKTLDRKIVEFGLNIGRAE
ncbi:helix-turn-helix domain-containing protein [Geobacter sp. FeAm09]|uniref:helix-turn-helix domain-containing protein n=1 Tax=Geobacter sp. FeAm09 TaxID=2597769 RepID=UPI00351BE210